MRSSIVIGFCGLFLAAGLCRGQYMQFDAAQRGHPIVESRPSIRLMAMGGLAWVVADEDNEINLSDFGGNLAGIARDKDGWSLESWFGRNQDLSRFDAPAGTGRLRWSDQYRQERAGMDFTYRKDDRRALGLRSSWTGVTATQPLAGNDRVRGPALQGFYNQNLGPLSLAMGASRWSDNEDILASDVFSIRHFSTSWRTSLASAYQFGAWQAGGQLDLDRVVIQGRSSEPSGFHLNQFKWIRPATQWRLTLLRPLPARLSAGLNLGWYRRTGNEEARISLSGRFPRNPSQANFAIRVPTFEEEERGWDYSGRGLYQVTPTWNLAGAVQWAHSTWTVEESPRSNFPGSLSQEDAKYDTYRVGGGSGLVLLMDRLKLGAEAYYVRTKTTSTHPRETATLRTRDVEARIGAEWLLPTNLALRAGFGRGAEDTDLDLSQTLFWRNGLTFGFGYVPDGGVVSLDAALQVLQERPDKNGGVEKRTETQNLAVAVRFLF